MKSDFYTTLIWVSQNTVTPISVMVSAPVMVPAPVIPDDTKAKCSGAGIGGGLRQENRYRHRYRWRYHLTLNSNIPLKFEDGNPAQVWQQTIGQKQQRVGVEERE